MKTPKIKKPVPTRDIWPWRLFTVVEEIDWMISVHRTGSVTPESIAVIVPLTQARALIVARMREMKLRDPRPNAVQLPSTIKSLGRKMKVR